MKTSNRKSCFPRFGTENLHSSFDFFIIQFISKMFPRKIFADISSLEKNEKEHVRNVIARAEWIPGQVNFRKLFLRQKIFSDVQLHIERLYSKVRAC